MTFLCIILIAIFDFKEHFLGNIFFHSDSYLDYRVVIWQVRAELSYMSYYKYYNILDTPVHFCFIIRNTCVIVIYRKNHQVLKHYSFLSPTEWGKLYVYIFSHNEFPWAMVIISIYLSTNNFVGKYDVHWKNKHIDKY